MKKNEGRTFLEWAAGFLLAGLMLFSLTRGIQALEIKQSTAYVDKAVMLNNSNASQAITGLSNTTTTLYYVKNTGAAAQATIFNLQEIDSTNMPGLYNVTFNSSVTDTVGPFVYYLKNGTVSTFRGKHEIVANLESDTYGKVDTEVGDILTIVDGMDLKVSSILADTEAVDTTTEMRTFLTGSDTPVSTLTATDNIGINWGDITNPTTSQTLSGTTISTSQVVASVSGAVGSVSSAVNINSNSDITAIKSQTDKLTFDGSNRVIANATVIGDKTGYSLTQTFPGNFSAMNITSDGNVTTAGSSDPWNVALPGGYAAGKAGYIVGTNIDALISSRLATIGYTAPDNSGISAIKAQTDKITFDASNRTIANATTVGDKTGYTASTVSDKTGYSLAGTQAYNNTGNLLGNVSNVTNGVSLTTGAIQAIWDALTSALNTANSVGKLIVDNLNAAITSRMATFTLPGNFSALNITSDGNVTANPGASGATAQQVWEYNISAINSSGYAGTKLNSAASGSNASAIADAVWDEPADQHTTSGTTGKKLNEMPSPYDIGP